MMPKWLKWLILRGYALKRQGWKALMPKTHWEWMALAGIAGYFVGQILADILIWITN